ncbi:unnamed protein product, partial [Didymodactylos carnosus]
TIMAILAAIITGISILFLACILFCIAESFAQDRVHAINSHNTAKVSKTVVVTDLPRAPHQINTHVSTAKRTVEERATSPVDERILKEFYNDKPKDTHMYALDGRQYVVYEKNITDIDVYRRG